MGWCGEVSAKSVVHACRASGTQREPRFRTWERRSLQRHGTKMHTESYIIITIPSSASNFPLLFRPILTQIFWDDRPVCLFSLASPRHFAACVTDLRQRLGCHCASDCAETFSAKWTIASFFWEKDFCHLTWHAIVDRKHELGHFAWSVIFAHEVGELRRFRAGPNPAAGTTRWVLGKCVGWKAGGGGTQFQTKKKKRVAREQRNLHKPTTEQEQHLPIRPRRQGRWIFSSWCFLLEDIMCFLFLFWYTESMVWNSWLSGISIWNQDKAESVFLASIFSSQFDILQDFKDVKCYNIFLRFSFVDTFFTTPPNDVFATRSRANGTPLAGAAKAQEGGSRPCPGKHGMTWRFYWI